MSVQQTQSARQQHTRTHNQRGNLPRCTLTHIYKHQYKNLHKANTLEKTLRKRHTNHRMVALIPDAHSTCSRPRNPNNTQMDTPFLPCTNQSTSTTHTSKAPSTGWAVAWGRAWLEHAGDPRFHSQHCKNKRNQALASYASMREVSERSLGIGGQLSLHSKFLSSRPTGATC